MSLEPSQPGGHGRAVCVTVATLLVGWWVGSVTNDPAMGLAAAAVALELAREFDQ
jgi:hypothetical protein